MPTWPATLPQYCLKTDYKETLPDTILRTKMDQGPARTRPRFTAGVRPFDWGQKFSPAQVETFETFFTVTTARGALSFDFPHPRRGPGVTITVKFVGPPEYSALGGTRIYVKFKLEQQP